MLRTKSCVFCGARGKLTAEHVYPTWTRDIVMPSVRGESGLIFGDDGRYEVIPNADVATLTVNRVCGPCNHGWLSRLEERAKPLLSAPIRGNPRTFRFLEVHTIAAWAYKTCLLASLTSSQLMGPLGFRWLQRSGCPPSGVVITIAAYGGPRFAQYGAFTPVEYSFQIGQEPRKQICGYQLTIGIGHLVFQTFGHHIQGVVDLTPSNWKKEYSTVVWPPPDELKWPPSKALDDNGLFAFAGGEMPNQEQQRHATWKHGGPSRGQRD
jgi:hypothetical protein